MVKSVFQLGLETCFLPKMTVSGCCGLVLSPQPEGVPFTGQQPFYPRLYLHQCSFVPVYRVLAIR